jgi:hypothetical protein
VGQALAAAAMVQIANGSGRNKVEACRSIDATPSSAREPPL